MSLQAKASEMEELENRSSGKLWWLLCGSVALLAILLSIMLSPASAQTSDAAAPDVVNDTVIMPDSANAVTNLATLTLDGLDRSTSYLGQSFARSGQTLASAASRGGRVAGGGLTTIGRGVGSAARFGVQAATNGVIFSLRAPAAILGATTNAPVVSSLVKPASQAAVPVINPLAPIALAARVTQAALPVPAASATVWPLHGQITTPFGVPELPYQAIHTGLDISDGWHSGSTPIKAFKAGKVLSVIRGNTGLGNHVILDHGDGLTSVYGHLASISVQPGQAVDTTTVIGYEGSTGVSTGPHLHFEVRVDGVPMDPHQFITGQPY